MTDNAKAMVELEELMMRARRAYDSSHDLPYEARTDYFNKIDRMPLWVAVDLSVKNGAQAIFGIGSAFHAVRLLAYMPDEEMQVVFEVLFPIDGKSEAFKYGRRVNNIVIKIELS